MDKKEIEEGAQTEGVVEGEGMGAQGHFLL